jgi:hypothetical protein
LACVPVLFPNSTERSVFGPPAPSSSFFGSSPAVRASPLPWRQRSTKEHPTISRPHLPARVLLKQRSCRFPAGQATPTLPFPPAGEASKRISGERRAGYMWVLQTKKALRRASWGPPLKVASPGRWPSSGWSQKPPGRRDGGRRRVRGFRGGIAAWERVVGRFAAEGFAGGR